MIFRVSSLSLLTAEGQVLTANCQWSNQSPPERSPTDSQPNPIFLRVYVPPWW